MYKKMLYLQTEFRRLGAKILFNYINLYNKLHVHKFCLKSSI